MIRFRRPKIHPVIDGQKVISHRARQRVILHGWGRGGRVGDSQGVAVTGACNDHSPLPPRHRDSLAATSKTTPVPPRPPPPLPTRENVYGERHVRSMRRKDVGGMRMCIQRVWFNWYVGLWGTFCSRFFISSFFQ